MKDLKWLIVGILFIIMAILYNDILPLFPGGICFCVWGESNGYLSFKKRGKKKA